MKILRLAIVFCALSTALRGASFHEDFAVVFIDAASEAKFGAFPLDRSILAKAIRKAASLGAKGVVLKFFFDQPKSELSDLSLEQALTNVPVLLEARMDDSQIQPNALPNQFTFPGVKARTRVSGQTGWIPLLRFSEKAAGVGFVDFSTTVVPLLETYQSRTVKSLTVCCIELATGKKAIIQPSESLKFGTRELRMDSHNGVSVKLPAKDDLEYIPFHRLVAGETPAGEIEGQGCDSWLRWRSDSFHLHFHWPDSRAPILCLCAEKRL
ncbi:MAG TPA: CHASE2 domain-containing protein [Verrucomicrobiae bacterium]|jgi:hypothetical protein|nr:CHASE2 domain-containing protein [Verrucomicrobiae bacterium]